MNIPKIGIVLSTTREGRFADKPTAWLDTFTSARTDLHFERVDLRDYPMPMFDWPFSPSRTPITHEAVVPWRDKVASLDGFVFITAEYNRSIPAVLKNAIDHAYVEWNRKAAAYVGYGSVGAARAVEHLRNISVEMQMAPVRAGVHISRDALLPVRTGEKTLDDFPYLADQAKAMLDDLAWWAWTLKAGRETPPRS